MTETALLTGGAGFVGLHLARRLLARDVRVTLVDDLSRGRNDAALNELLPHVNFVQHDLTLPLPGRLANTSFTWVFHLAAIVGVRNVTNSPERVLRVNLRTTLNLLDWCAQHPPRTFFLSSTSEVADGAREVLGEHAPLAEDATFVLSKPLMPRASYALSKLSCEVLAAHYARNHGFRAVVGRYYNVYGPRMGYDHVIPELMQRAHARCDPFPVWAPDHSRAFCYVDDAVEATVALMELDARDPLIVDIGNDSEEVSVETLARMVLELADHRVAIEARPAPPGSPRRRLPDLRRLKALTGWTPRVPLRPGLARTWHWYSTDLGASTSGSVG